MLTICVSPTGDTQIVNIQVRAFLLSPAPVGAPSLYKGGLFSRWIPVVLIHAWRGSTADRGGLSEAGRCGLAGPLAPWARGMPRAGWAGRPNSGLAVCAGQRTRARRHRAPKGEGALLAKHCFASARTHSRQGLGRTAERGLRRVLPTHTAPPSTGMQLSLLRLPASGRHYRGCRAAARLRRRSARRPSPSAGRRRTGSRRRG